MKQIKLIITLFWMALLLAPQTTFAVQISNPQYLLSSLSGTNRDLKFNFELTNYTPSDKVEAKLFAGFDRLILKSILEFNENDGDSIQKPHEGINYCVLKNLKEGIPYRVVFFLNGKETEYGILTTGTPSLVAEDLAGLSKEGIDLYWLYNSENKPDEFKIIFDNKETFVSPSFVLDLSNTFMFDRGKPNTIFVNYDSFGLPKERIHYKIIARSGNETIETPVQSFLIPDKNTWAIKKTTLPNIKVFPNPAKDYLIVEAQSNTLLTIYNSLGQLILTQTLTTGSTKMEIDLQNGLYTATFTSNGKTISKIISIQK